MTSPSSYKEMIEMLSEAYPEFDIVMGTTNELRSPQIIIALSGIQSASADNEMYIVHSATYQIMFYVESTSMFNPWPAASAFGNLAMTAFDGDADGEIFTSIYTIKGPNALWNKE